MQGFSPLDLSPALWLDASDTSTITASGGLVSQWNDKSGNGRNVSQATSANQPITGTTTLNGLNVITYDGSNDVLLSAANAPDVTAMSCFAVARHSSFDSIAPRVVDLTGANGTGRLLIVRDDIASKIADVVISTDAVQNTRFSNTGVMTTNVWRHFGFVWAGGITTASNLTFRVMGADSNGTYTAGTGSIVSTTNLTYRIGNSVTGARSWPGEFAEIIVWHRALSTSEVNSIEAYFSTKWGL